MSDKGLSRRHCGTLRGCWASSVGWREVRLEVELMNWNENPQIRVCTKQGASWPKDRGLRKLGAKGAEELRKEVENRR